MLTAMWLRAVNVDDDDYNGDRSDDDEDFSHEAPAPTDAETL